MGWRGLAECSQDLPEKAVRGVCEACVGFGADEHRERLQPVVRYSTALSGFWGALEARAQPVRPDISTRGSPRFLKATSRAFSGCMGHKVLKTRPAAQSSQSC